MRRILLPAVITVVVVALLAVLAFGVSSSGPSNALAAKVSRGQRPAAPNASMPLQLMSGGQKAGGGKTAAGGKTATLKDFRGKVVMVNVFAGWCVACQNEVAVLKHAQRVLAAHGGELVGVTYQDSTPDAQGYLKKYGLNFPVLLDPGDKFIAPYGVNGVPETFIIGANGDVVAARTYQLTNSWVDKTLTRVLGAQT